MDFLSLKRYERINLFALFLYGIMAISTKTVAQSYSLSGILPQIPDGKLFLVRSDWHSPEIDSCTVKDGKFLFTGTVEYPQWVYLSKSRKKGGIVYFFLENAEILLTQSLDKKVIVSGSQSQTEYEDWISSTNTQTWQTLNDSIRDKFLRFSDISDKISAGIELDSLQKIRELRNIQAFYAFHEKYPSSNIKGFILENSLSQISLSEKEKLVTLCHKQDKESDFFRPYQVRMNVEKKVIGLSLYDIKILDTANYTKTLGDFKGKVLLVEFWASWCKPCRKKHREWQNMYKQYHPLGLEILSLSMDTEQGKWETAAKSDSISWGNIHEPRGFSSPLCQLFDIKHIPYYFFVNPEGIIEARNEDFISLIGRIEHHLGKH